MQAEVQPGNVLMMVKRNLAGSVGDIQHGTEAKYRAVFTKQLQDDIFTDIIATEVWANQHVNVVADPHTQYLLEDDAEATYVELAGDRMTGRLFLISSVPTDPDHASPKSYVDQAEADAKTYTDDEIALLSGVYLPIGDKYTDGDAVAAMGTVGDSNTLNHERYDDSDARAAVDNDTYLKLDGSDVMTGSLRMGSHAILDLTNIEIDELGGRLWFRAYPYTYLRLDTGSNLLLAHDNHVVAGRTAAGDYNYGNGVLRISSSNITTFGGQVRMGGNRIEGVGNANSDDDALNLGQANSSYLKLVGGVLTGPLTLPAADGSTTTLRWVGMGTNDGIYGDGNEISAGFDGARMLTVWSLSSAIGRDGGIVEIRAGTAPYVLQGDGNGVSFKLTAHALKWLADNHN